MQYVNQNTFKSQNTDTLTSQTARMPLVDNVFQNNLLEMFSPEMLSSDETVTLMTEILKRAVDSAEMRVKITSSAEFKKLVRLVYHDHSEM